MQEVSGSIPLSSTKIPFRNQCVDNLGILAVSMICVRGTPGAPPEKNLIDRWIIS